MKIQVFWDGMLYNYVTVSWCSEGTIILWTLGNCMPNDRASHPRRPKSSATPLQEHVTRQYMQFCVFFLCINIGGNQNLAIIIWQMDSFVLQYRYSTRQCSFSFYYFEEHESNKNWKYIMSETAFQAFHKYTKHIWVQLFRNFILIFFSVLW